MQNLMTRAADIHKNSNNIDKLTSNSGRINHKASKSKLENLEPLRYVGSKQNIYYRIFDCDFDLVTIYVENEDNEQFKHRLKGKILLVKLVKLMRNLNISTPVGLYLKVTPNLVKTAMILEPVKLE